MGSTGSVIPLTAAAVALAASQAGAPFAAPTTPPDRLSVDKASPHYDECYKRVGVRLNGFERQGDVQEYCVPEGWIEGRVRDGKGRFKIDGDGRYVLQRLTGSVLAYFKDGRPTKPIHTPARDPATDTAAISAAEAKRRRKAEKLKKDSASWDS